MCYRALCIACMCESPFFPEAALITPFYSRREAQGRDMHLLRGVFLLAEAACPSPVACHCGGMVGGAVLSSVHWSDAPVMPDPVRCGSSCGGRRSFFYWRRAGYCMFDRRGVPRLG